MTARQIAFRLMTLAMFVVALVGATGAPDPWGY